jgi:hypothetical protein
MKRLFQLFFGLMAMAALTGSVHAATGPYGRDYGISYFQGTFAPGYLNWVFVPYPLANYDGLGPGCDVFCTVTEASFFNTFQTRLNDPDQSDAGRAAAIIDIMLGQDGPTFGGSISNGVSYAQAHFQQWKDLVDFYAKGTAGYSVNWNDFIDFTGVNVNAMGWTGTSDTDSTKCFPVSTYMCMGDIEAFDTFDDPEFDYAAVFTAPSGGQFVIKRKCANLTGDLSGLPRPTSTINLTKTSTNPAPMPIGTNMQYSITAKEASPALSLTNVTITDKLPIEFKYVSPAGSTPAPAVSGGGPGGQTLTWTFNSPADAAVLGSIAGAGFNLSVNVQAVVAGTDTNTATGTAVDEWGDSLPVNPGSVTNTVTGAIKHPSVEAHGSDVHAGGGACGAALSSGHIDTNLAAGSYGDFVVSSPGSIFNMGSNGSPSDVSLRIGPNGGYNEVCRPDLYDFAVNNLPSGYSTLSAGAYNLGSDFTGSPTIAFDGTRAVAYVAGDLDISGDYTQNFPLTLVVTGKVSISGDITVNAGTTDRGTAPAVGIIAGGPIQIQDAARNVRAMLFSNTAIDTCYTAPPGFPWPPGHCDNTLTVKGFLMAPDILLHRLGP